MLEKFTIPALRGTGNPEDAGLADALTKRIEERGDFPLSNGVSMIEEKPQRRQYENTSRLLRSFDGIIMVSSGFLVYGSGLHWVLNPRNRGSHWGGRSEGVKKT